MTSSVLFAFLHHAAAFALVAVVMVEFVLMRGELTVASARTLLRMDSVYGMCAVVLLIVGFVRVFNTEKGADYYFHSGPFLAKLALFIGVGETFQIWNPKTVLADPNIPEDMKDIARFRLEERGL